jgi:predicted nucleic acid-binding protein
MNYNKILLDTAFIQALLNKKDEYHLKAVELSQYLRRAKEVWITEAILIELGNALSKMNRKVAVSFINNCYETPNIKVIPIDNQLFKKALSIYEKYEDKEWGMTDCISIVVMKENNIKIAFTADNHFKQAGFEIVL